MYGFIYITTNCVNGKRYIGQSSYNKKNWERYLGSGKYLRAAIKKYGSANFKRTIVCEADTREELSEFEIYFIKFYDAVKSPLFYNVAIGGYTTRGFVGKKHTRERNELVSRKLQGHPVSDNVRSKCRTTGQQFGKSVGVKNLIPFTGGINHPHSKRVIIDGNVYCSLTEAHLSTGISKHMLRKLLHP